MCGIAGILSFGNSLPSVNQIKEQSSILQPRGPDNFDAVGYKNAILCHHRLSIIDLDSRSNQPLRYGKMIISFNGEIYNFKAIRNELEHEGLTFNTSSDTEVLVAACSTWGVKYALKKVKGMFALAIIDTESNQLTIARDVFGQKPLYYGSFEDEFVFSSDIRFIKKRQSNLTLDLKSLDFYFQELSMPQPRTIWEEVRQLSPGTYSCIDMNTGFSETKSYHEFDFSAKKYTWDEALYCVEESLLSAVLRRTESSIPIACFLSGGIDSGLIVSLLAKNSSAKVNTFSVGFREEEFNELKDAKRLAMQYDTNHTEMLIEPNISDVVFNVLSDIGEPFGDSSLIPSYLITREMGSAYKVALSGDGGDELFGYPSYAQAYALEQLLHKKGLHVPKLKIAISKLNSRLGIGPNLGGFKQYLSSAPDYNLLRRDMAFSDDELDNLLEDRTTHFGKDYLSNCWSILKNQGLTNKVIGGSLKSRLLNDYLVKVDRASMLNSLEVRSPFLDVDLAQLSFQIPNSIKFKNYNAKALLKELAKKYVDVNIEKRPKSGFGIPINHWLRNELKPLLYEYLSSEQLAKHGLFQENCVRRLMDEHMTGKADNRHQLWCLLSFQIWYERNMA